MHSKVLSLECKKLSIRRRIPIERNGGFVLVVSRYRLYERTYEHTVEVTVASEVPRTMLTWLGR